jgi:small subunit ribosomal protein S6
MPQYELMYLLSSAVADDEVPKISEQILKFVGDFGGKDIKETQLGKKKLAYPIKKTRNGHYVVVNFSIDGKDVNQLDAKIRTQNTIIRYLLINLEEHLDRMEKDKLAQSKLVRRQPVEGAADSPAKPSSPERKAPAPGPIIEIDQEELDKKIEAALSEDLTK